MTPASRRRRASGYGDLVENSIAGSRPATTPLEASASTSASVRYVQWSAEAAPTSAASWTPGPSPSWLAWMRGCSPHAKWIDVFVEHRPGHQRHVPRRVVRVLGRYDMGAEVRRLVGELPRDLQAARLVRDRQAIPGLDLDRGRALAAHLGDEPGHVRGQLLVGRLAGRRDRGPDATGRVRRTGHPGGELRRAVAREHQM